MPRFFDPARYNEDWYIDLKGEYQKFFDYIIETCDNAGVWKPNKFDFETKTGFKVNLDSLLERVNKDKERISVLENGRWFIPGFIKFQWFNRVSSFNLSPGNPRHLNIVRSLDDNNIPYKKVRGLVEVCQRSKDTDKDIGVLEEKEKNFPEVVTGEVTYDAETTILANQIEFEKICMVTGKSEKQGKKVLRKYHLWLEERHRYPMGRKAVFAGFEKWMMNEKVEKAEPSINQGPPLKKLNGL
jgi:hypothetical protein